jgi:hypothetical protein
MFESARRFYSFREDTIQVKLKRETHSLPGHSRLWVTGDP